MTKEFTFPKATGEWGRINMEVSMKMIEAMLTNTYVDIQVDERTRIEVIPRKRYARCVEEP